MGSLRMADLAVLAAYLAGTGILGFLAARRVRGAADYFMPRRFGKAAMVMHAFGTGTASDQTVSVAAATARYGVSGIWFQWMWLFSTPFYWLIAPIMRRFRAVTTADVYALRYDAGVARLFAIVGIAGLSVKIGVMLEGAGALIEAGTGDLVASEWAVPAVTVAFVAYGMAGGLGAAILTDIVQGILTIVFSVMLLPVVLDAAGGLAGVRRTFALAGRGEEMLGLVAPEGVGAFFVVMLSINSLFLIVAMPSVMGNCAAGRSELDGRIGFMCGTLVKRLCTVAWSLTALAGVAWYLQNDIAGVDPDKVYGDLARRFLPQLMPGMLGIFVASLLAAVMSSCDSFMVASSGLFTENVYRPLVPGRSERHYVLVGRIASLGVVLGGVLFTYAVDDVVEALKTWYKMFPMIGIAFWLGLLWRRATPAGAWAATITGFAAWWLGTRDFLVEGLADLPLAAALGIASRTESGARMAEPWLILFYLSAGLLAGVIASLATRPVPRQRLDRFYALTRTPVERDEVVAAPCTLPRNTRPAARPLLLDAFGLQVPRPSRLSVAGFLAGWAAVGALIGGFVLLVGA